MQDDVRVPQINMSKLPVAAGFAGAIFVAGSAAIFLAGIPALRYMFPAALVLGCGIAVVFHLMNKQPKAPTTILG